MTGKWAASSTLSDLNDRECQRTSHSVQNQITFDVIAVICCRLNSTRDKSDDWEVGGIEHFVRSERPRMSADESLRAESNHLRRYSCYLLPPELYERQK